MIITRTPFRISFFGGGTDYPAWYKKHGGAVLVTSINKYCYLTCRDLPPFFQHKYRIVYVKSENTRSIEEISHPAVRGILKHLEWRGGLEIHHDADLPARGGMGSSSAFTVGLLHALHALKGRMVSKYDLALESIHVEQDILKETVGSQDQVSVAVGGLNHIQFLPGGQINVTPVTIAAGRIRELESHLMLFYSGIERTAAKVAGSYADNIEEKAAQMRKMAALVDRGLAILNSDCAITEFGKLLHEAWQVKRAFSNRVSNGKIDGIYQRAVENGAIGGKILGAGGGGFVLVFVEPQRQRKVREGLKDLVHVPFKFETGGSQVLFYEPGEDYSGTAEDNAGCTFDRALDLDLEDVVVGPVPPSGGTRPAVGL
jgi:D-glycero-alpha-D-manno-heptose-7-phosphate kinase